MTQHTDYPVSYAEMRRPLTVWFATAWAMLHRYCSVRSGPAETAYVAR